MLDFDHLRFYRETFEAQFGRLQTDRFTLHLPRPLQGGIRRVAGTHFHFDPEIFIQIGGLTDFSFPREKVRLLAGEALLVPRGLPHIEIARKFRGDFLTIVIICLHDGFRIHTTELDNGRRNIHGLENFKTDKVRQIEQYLDDIVDLYHSGGNGKEKIEIKQAVRGLFQATIAILLLVIKPVKTFRRVTEPPKVSECRKFILNNICDPSLSVKKLAEQIRCSSDYLSHLFVTETGEHLTDYIHQERIALAKRHLQNPALNIKEIAWSCGFSDTGYFTTLFKRFAGETPKSFRQKFAKTIFLNQ